MERVGAGADRKQELPSDDRSPAAGAVRQPHASESSAPAAALLEQPPPGPPRSPQAAESKQEAPPETPETLELQRRLEALMGDDRRIPGLDELLEILKLVPPTPHLDPTSRLHQLLTTLSMHLHRELRLCAARKSDRSCPSFAKSILDSGLPENLKGIALRPTGEEWDDAIARAVQWSNFSRAAKREHLRQATDSAIQRLRKTVDALPAKQAESKQETPSPSGIVGLDLEHDAAGPASKRAGLTESDEQLFDALRLVPPALLKIEFHSRAFETLDEASSSVCSTVFSLAFIYLRLHVHECSEDGDDIRAAALAKAIGNSGLAPSTQREAVDACCRSDARGIEAVTKAVLDSDWSEKTRFVWKWIAGTRDAGLHEKAAALYVQLLTAIPDPRQRASEEWRLGREALMRGLQATEQGRPWARCIVAMEAIPEHPQPEPMSKVLLQLAQGNAMPVAVHIDGVHEANEAECLNKRFCAVQIDAKNPEFLLCVSSRHLHGSTLLGAQLRDDKAGGRRYEYPRISGYHLRPIDLSAALGNARDIVAAELGSLPTAIRDEMRDALAIRSCVDAEGVERPAVTLDLSRASPGLLETLTVAEGDNHGLLTDKVEAVFGQLGLAIQPPAHAWEAFKQISKAQNMWVVRTSREIPGIQ
jgi:hypothetical protein